MPITGEGRFTFARFTASNQRWIEAVWMTADGTYEETLIEADLTNRDYKLLLEAFTVDEIKTMTDQFAKDEQAEFNDLVMRMAEDHGLVYDPNAADQKDRLNIDHIFEPPEGDDGTDLLFNIKLKIFELDEVTNSEDDDLKRALREADTPLKAFYIAGQFLYAE